MGWRRARRESSEELLRSVREEAPDEFVSELASRIPPKPPTQRRHRFAVAGIATAAMLVGLAAVGGVGHAAYRIEHLAKVAVGQTNTFGRRVALEINGFSAANDEYGTTTTAAPPPPTTTSTQTTQSAPPPTQPQTQATGPGDSGSVTVQPSGTTTQVSVDWQPTTFSVPVTVVVDPAPPVVTTAALVGTGNQVISITATDPATGAVVHTLSAPLAVRFSNPPKGFVPAISTDGKTFRTVSLLSGTTLPDNQQDGYYVDTNGDIVVLTRHLTLFAVLAKANIDVSETGKLTPPAGSGKFGDPTRNHVGPPVLKTAAWPYVTGASNGTRVSYVFSVDEQAAVYLTILDAHGKPVWISRAGTTVRGEAYTGKRLHTLHLVILRPGLIKTNLKVPALTPHETYTLRVRAVDYDGHVVTTKTSFTA
jgi:hypothetical protein